MKHIIFLGILTINFLPNICLGDEGLWQWSFPQKKCDFRTFTIDGFLAESKQRGMICQLVAPHDEARVIQCSSPKEINYYFFSNKVSCEKARYNFTHPEYAVDCRGAECTCTTEMSVTLKQLYNGLKKTKPYCQYVDNKKFQIVACIDPVTRMSEFHFGGKSAKQCQEALAFAKDLMKGSDLKSMKEK